MVPRLQEFNGIVNSHKGWDLLLENKKDDVII